jgi:hypothetical protein
MNLCIKIGTKYNNKKIIEYRKNKINTHKINKDNITTNNIIKLITIK